MNGLNWMRRVPVIAAVWLAVALFMLPAPKAEALSYYPQAFPTGTIGLTKPQIGMNLQQIDGHVSPSSYSLYLNNKEVPVTFGSDKYVYTPNQDLTPGTYEVRITIQFSGYEPITKSWSFTVARNAIAELPTTYTGDQIIGLAAINDYRLIYGLPPLSMNSELTAAAQKHAEYLNKNSVNGSEVSLHDERPSLPGFIGEKLSDRRQFVGYLEGMAEDVSYTSGSLTDAIDQLFDAPYHRIPFLAPSTMSLGVAKEGDYTVLEFGMDLSQEPKLVLSPAPGDAYAPTQFEGHEFPDPLRLHTTSSYPVGYPIMAAVSGAKVKQVSLISAKLTDSKGNEVKLLTNAPGADDHLDTEVIFMPAKPLDYDASYQASVKLSASLTEGGTQSFEQQWTFHTEPSDGMGKRKLHSYAADYKRKMTADMGAVKHVAEFGLDGSAYVLDNVTFPMKIKPYIENGTSYLWVRDLAAALGASVDWSETERAAIYSKNGRTVKFYTTKPMYSLYGNDQSTDDPAKLIGGNTMIPVRLLSEVLGAKVEYTDATRTVTISY